MIPINQNDSVKLSLRRFLSVASVAVSIVVFDSNVNLYPA